MLHKTTTHATQVGLKTWKWINENGHINQPDQRTGKELLNNNAFWTWDRKGLLLILKRIYKSMRIRRIGIFKISTNYKQIVY